MNKEKAASVLQNIGDYDLGMVINAGRYLLKHGEDPNCYLYDLLKETNAELRIKAVHVLLVTGNKETPKYLEPLLESDDVDQIAAVLEALAFGRAPQAFSIACEHLHHVDLTVRRAALSAMRLIRVVEALPILLDYLDEELPREIADEVIVTVYELGGSRPFVARWKKMSINTKVRILRAMPNVRSAAFHQFRDTQQELLSHILNGDQADVIIEALKVIGVCHSPDFKEELELLFESDQSFISDKAGRLLVESLRGDQRLEMELRVTMQRMARRHAGVVQQYCGIELDFTERSILEIDKIISGGWPWNGPCLQSRNILFASYLGEVIRRNLGGQWRHSTEIGYHLVVPGKKNAAISPFSLVKRRFDKEDTRPLGQFYDDLKELVRP